MDVEDIRRAVLATIRSIAPEVDLERIRPDLPLREQVELDSMDWIGVFAGLDERLSVDIPASAYAQLESIDAIVGFVTSHRARRPGASRIRGRASARAPRRSTHWILGHRVTVRPIRRDDMERDAEFVRNLSDDSRYERFMTAVRELPPEKLRAFTDVDQRNHVALVATIERDGRPMIVGVSRYIVDASGSNCEFAVAVGDDWHGTGLAGILMLELMRIARSRGLATMEGFVLATNSRMLRFARQLGFTPVRDAGARETLRVVCRLQEPVATAP